MLKNKLAVTVIGVATISLVAGGGAGYWFAQQNESPQSTSASQQQDAKVLYWYDPMKPEQHFDKPGKSPFMDMQLVPKYADENTAMTDEPVEGHGAQGKIKASGLRIENAGQKIIFNGPATLTLYRDTEEGLDQ